VSCPISKYRDLENQKGKFIIATNELDDNKLPDKEVFTAYKGLSKVERGFRFLKDPQFVASSLFVKKPERVEALVFIMTLCLAAYAALEYRIREGLALEDEHIPNQLGKKVQNPTARWVFEMFTGIHLLYGLEKPIILNTKEVHTKIIDLLGAKYRKYYFRE
jgi:transposase